MAAASLELLAELDATEGWPPERCAGVVDQIAKLFLHSIENLSTHQIDLFDNVLVRLMHRVDTQSLSRLSEKLAEAKCALPQVNRRLAFDENESVSLPILKSRGLSQELLLDLVRSGGPHHRLVIATRYPIDPLVGEALLEYDEPAVHHAVAENVGTGISDAGWIRLVELGENDSKLAKKLVHRADIPSDFRLTLQASVKDARVRHLQAMPRVVHDQIAEAVSAKATASMLPDPGPDELAPVQARLMELSRKGKLRDSAVNRAVANRDYVEVIVALALLTGSSTKAIRALLASDKLESLALVCKAARLTWGTTALVVKNRPGMPQVSVEELEEVKKTFQSVCLSAAQLAVRF